MCVLFVRLAIINKRHDRLCRFVCCCFPAQSPVSDPECRMQPTSSALSAGQRAERKVFHSLAQLPPPWQYFPTVEWRALQPDGEQVGEADVVVFHPHWGLVVFEIKAGAVDIRNGVWYYASNQAMKQSPFSQARRNRYALMERLRHRLGKPIVDQLTITHAVWLPEVHWKAALPGIEAPSRAFLLDRDALHDAESALLRLFRDAVSQPVSWTRSQQHAVKELLAPDCQLLVPLAVEVDQTVGELYHATVQQIAVLRMLRTQPRLLVEGGAGSGKTLLACALAREHAAQGKSVLLTCFNRQLALHLMRSLAHIPQIRVANFHELVKQVTETAGLPYAVPADAVERSHFFHEGAAEMLLSATEWTDLRFDTIIVDEGADFAATWWVGLEALGRTGFNWYCFYDRQQSIYQTNQDWEPPFNVPPMTLDVNLRNAKPIGEFAARIGHCHAPTEFRVQTGTRPVVLQSESFAVMATHLRQLLADLIHKECLAPDRLVVLAPYRHTNPQSTWSAGLDQVTITTELAEPEVGKVRVGTIQGFKGLESDVVILAGIDFPAGKRRDWLYVGASRARGALYVLALSSVELEQKPI